MAQQGEETELEPIPVTTVVNTSTKEDWVAILENWIRNTPGLYRILMYAIPIALIVISITIVVVCWFILLPPELAQPKEKGRGIVFFFYLVMPVVSAIVSYEIFTWLVSLRDTTKPTYEEVLNKQEAVFRSSLDETGLRPILNLITYSRDELKLYYQMGYSQQKKSYRNSVIAMWFGFLIIAVGIALYLVPFPQVNTAFLNGNLQILTIGSGIVLELVSGLFFYMYHESSNKLTYLYNRQRVLYDSMICLQISKEKEADPKLREMIVSNILDKGRYGTTRSFFRKKQTEIAKEPKA